MASRASLTRRVSSAGVITPLDDSEREPGPHLGERVSLDLGAHGAGDLSEGFATEHIGADLLPGELGVRGEEVENVGRLVLEMPGCAERARGKE